ncbi:hypothetical protein K7432_005767 [Basidiobolus ranarum]|uniref:Uncharacterized protein n=1 Tax=Basidiobolus ranarum TaxID=34480 RepID=A0ABR2WW49_9FUNG
MITCQTLHTTTLPRDLSHDPSIYHVNITGSEVCVRDTLFNLLDEHHRRFHIEYGGYLANYIAHNLFSLYALGATSACLTEYFEQTSPKLERFPPSKIHITEANWRLFLGQKKYYTDYVKFFDECISTFGLLETFQRYGSILISGLLGNSLHPLIHLGFGIEFEHPSVTSEGLAYAAMSYLSHGEIIDEPSSPSKDNQDCKQILEMVRTDKRFDGPFEGLFQNKVKILVKSRGDLLKRYVDAWVICGVDINPVEKLHELTRIVTQMYASECRKNQPNVFLGHILTSSRAINSLIPHLSSVDQTRLLRVYWLAVISLYIIQGRPHIQSHESDEMEVERLKAWPSIIHQVLLSQDEKVPNLVRTLMWVETETKFNHGLYRNTAEMTVSMIKEYQWGVDGIGWWTVK